MGVSSNVSLGCVTLEKKIREFRCQIRQGMTQTEHMVLILSGLTKGQTLYSKSAGNRYSGDKNTSSSDISSSISNSSNTLLLPISHLEVVFKIVTCFIPDNNVVLINLKDECNYYYCCCICGRFLRR